MRVLFFVLAPKKGVLFTFDCLRQQSGLTIVSSRLEVKVKLKLKGKQEAGRTREFGIIRI